MPLAPDLDAWLRLSLTQGLGGESFRKLLLAFGGPEQIVWRQPLGARARGQPARSPMPYSMASCYGDPATVETWLADANNHVVTLADADYPQALLQTPDPPPLLYVKGRRELLNHAGDRRCRQPQRHRARQTDGRIFRIVAVRMRGFPSSAAWRWASMLPRIAAGSPACHRPSPSSAPGSIKSIPRATVNWRTPLRKKARSFPNSRWARRRWRRIFRAATASSAAWRAAAWWWKPRCQRLADHRAHRQRAGQGRVRDPRLDPLHAVQRLPRTD